MAASTSSAGGAASDGSLSPSSIIGGSAEDAVKQRPVAVFWDAENCPLGRGVAAEAVAGAIAAALRSVGLTGPLQLWAYGDTALLSHKVKEGLSSTGISLVHVPSGRKDASDKAILVDMCLWCVEQPPPAVIMLISGDRDFANALHRLRLRGYHILLALPNRSVATALSLAADHVWDWQALSTGRLDALAAPSQERIRLLLAAFLLDASGPVTADAAAAFLRARGWRIDSDSILNESAFSEVFHVVSELKSGANGASGEVASSQQLLELDQAFFEISEASEMRSAPELLKKSPRILLMASATLKRDRMQPSEKAVRARAIMIARQKLSLEPNSQAGRVTDKEWEAALSCTLSAGALERSSIRSTPLLLPPGVSCWHYTLPSAPDFHPKELWSHFHHFLLTDRGKQIVESSQSKHSLAEALSESDEFRAAETSRRMELGDIVHLCHHAIKKDWITVAPNCQKMYVSLEPQPKEADPEEEDQKSTNSVGPVAPMSCVVWATTAHVIEEIIAVKGIRNPPRELVAAFAGSKSITGSPLMLLASDERYLVGPLAVRRTNKDVTSFTLQTIGRWQPRQIPGSLLAEKHVFALRGVEGAFLLGKMKSETLWTLLFEVGQVCPLWVASKAADVVPTLDDKPEESNEEENSKDVSPRLGGGTPEEVSVKSEKDVHVVHLRQLSAMMEGQKLNPDQFQALKERVLAVALK